MHYKNRFHIADFFLSLGAEVSEQLLLKLPPNVVEESARASISVLGECSVPSGFGH
jgi:hypothetical protein